MRALQPRTRAARVRLQPGFTLLEVMMGLALLGFALTVLIKSAAGSIFNAQQAQMMGVVTDLARGKVYEIEEKLLKEGFTDTDQSEDGKDFTEEGWPNIKYAYLVEQVELPSWDTLQAMAKGKDGAGSGAGSGSALGSGAGSGDPSLGGFENSALGGMLGMMGGGFGGGAGDASEARGASLIGSQYAMFQEILKVAIRKVTVTVTWQVMGRDRDLKIVVFFTDQSAMDKVLKGFGSSELPDDPGDSGSGSGSGSGKGNSNTPRPPRARGGT